MNYILFGGTFDPFTRGHFAVATAAARKYPDAQVVIIPSVVSWHRKDKQPLFSETDRAKIIKSLIITDSPDDVEYRMYVDTHEYALPPALREGRGFVDTLRYFIESRSFITNRGPNTFKFIIGADEWNIFNKWKNHEEVLRMASPIVVCRAGSTAPHGVETLEIPAEYADVSASKIREAILQRFDRSADGDIVDWYLTATEFWGDDEETADEAEEVAAEDQPSEVETLLKTPIFDVQRIASDIPGFRPIRVKSPDWVCVIAKKGDAFIGVRQRRWGTGEEYDEFVTGVVDEGESSAQAAVRELREELGISVAVQDSHLVYLGSAPSNPGFMSNLMHYYYFDLDKGGYEVVEKSPDEHERLATVKIPFRVLPQSIEPPCGTPALMLAGLRLLEEWFGLERRWKGEVTT